MLASDYITYSQQIVDVILRKIPVLHSSYIYDIANFLLSSLISLKSEPQFALPTLYLIDSILKNVGGVYIQLFAEKIVDAFVAVYNSVRSHENIQHNAFLAWIQGDDKTRQSAKRVRDTWNLLFTPAVLQTIDRRIAPATIPGAIGIQN